MKISVLLKLFLTILLIAITAGVVISEEGERSHVTYKNSKGVEYFLFSKEVTLKSSDKTRTIYYFSKNPTNAKGVPVAEIPSGKIVSETKNGLPVLKNEVS